MFCVYHIWVVCFLIIVCVINFCKYYLIFYSIKTPAYSIICFRKDYTLSFSSLQYTIARSIGEFQTTIIVYNLLTRTRNTKYTAFCNKHIVRHFQSPIHHYCIPRYATVSYFPLVNCSEFSCLLPVSSSSILMIFSLIHI